MTPAALNYGTVPVGQSATGLSFTVTNSGGTPLTITKSRPPSSRRVQHDHPTTRRLHTAGGAIGDRVGYTHTHRQWEL